MSLLWEYTALHQNGDCVTSTSRHVLDGSVLYPVQVSGWNFEKHQSVKNAEFVAITLVMSANSPCGSSVTLVHCLPFPLNEYHP